MQTVLVRINRPSQSRAGNLDARGSIRGLVLRSGKSGFGPTAPAAIHRDDVLVAHFLQIVRRERGTEPAAAIQHQRRVFVRNRTFDIAFDNPFAQMNGIGKMAALPFVIFARVHEDHLFSGIQALLNVAKVGLFDAGLRFIHDFQKSWGMYMRHFSASDLISSNFIAYPTASYRASWDRT